MRNPNGIMFYPSLDLSGLSSEELQDKLSDVTNRLGVASRLSRHSEVLEQLNNLRNVLLTEQWERVERDRYAAAEPLRNRIIESDPQVRQPDPKREVSQRRDSGKPRMQIPIITKHWKTPPNEPIMPSKKET
jgi:hypothetical protein